MTNVREQQLHEDKVQTMSNSIPCVCNMIAARQMDFIGKMICGPPDRPSRNMITACCDHKRRMGCPQMTGKQFMVENLCLLFQDVPTIQIDRYGSLRSWIHEASNEICWCQLVNCLFYPSTPLPDRPNDWGPLPSWQAHRTAAGRLPTNDSNDSDDEPLENTKEDKPRDPPRSPPISQHDHCMLRSQTSRGAPANDGKKSW